MKPQPIVCPVCGLPVNVIDNLEKLGDCVVENHRHVEDFGQCTASGKSLVQIHKEAHGKKSTIKG